MRHAVSDSVVLAGFAALALASIGMKAVAGPPKDGSGDERRAEIQGRLVSMLRSQGFSTSVRPLRIQTPIVVARRGACMLSVRDARGGKAMVTQFARDAASIGAVRYFYQGHSYGSPPAMRVRIGRLETELLGRIGVPARAHITIALARSPGCGQDNFGLGDISLPA